MMNVKFITLGTLKEAYLRDAAAEYEKRLGSFCRFEMVQLKEERLYDDPSDVEIKNALEKEAEKERIRLEKEAEKQRLLIERMEREQEDRRRSNFFKNDSYTTLGGNAYVY